METGSRSGDAANPAAAAAVEERSARIHSKRYPRAAVRAFGLAVVGLALLSPQ